MDATYGSITTTDQNFTFALDSLAADFSDALDQAFWTFELQGEFEDALDAALLRTAFAGTPILSGGFLTAAA